MTTPVWPIDIPSKFLRDGYVERLGSMVVESTVDAGVSKLRRVTTAVPNRVEGQIRMTTEQWFALRRFFAVECFGRAREFLFQLPFVEGMSRVRFAAEPEAEPGPAPDRWRVSISLDVMPE